MGDNMVIIENSNELKKLKNKNNNTLIGTIPYMENSSIQFIGNNNILYCEDGVKILNSSIVFNNDNSLIYLSKSKDPYKLHVDIYNNSVFYMGRDNYINGVINMSLSERKHCFIGNDSIFSFGIWFRTSDPHLIYSTVDKNRLNNSKSIYLGDHVWIGQNALILKGTKVESGSIIAAMSVSSNKLINNNSSWGGNPIRKIKDDIFWDRSSVHRWTSDLTEKSKNYVDFIHDSDIVDPNTYIFEYDENSFISFEELENIFDSDDINSKLNFLINLPQNKNRFVNKNRHKKKFFHKK